MFMLRITDWQIGLRSEMEITEYQVRQEVWRETHPAVSDNTVGRPSNGVIPITLPSMFYGNEEGVKLCNGSN